MKQKFYRCQIFIVEHRRDSNWRHFNSGIGWQRDVLIHRGIEVDLQQSGRHQIGNVALRADGHSWKWDLVESNVLIFKIIQFGPNVIVNQFQFILYSRKSF